MGEDALRCFLLAMAALMLSTLSYIFSFSSVDWRILTLSTVEISNISQNVQNTQTLAFGLYQECLSVPRLTKQNCQDFSHSKSYRSDKARLLSAVSVPIGLILSALASIPALTRGCIGIKSEKHSNHYTKQCESMTKISAVLLLPAGVFGIVSSIIYLRDVGNCREVLVGDKFGWKQSFSELHTTSGMVRLVGDTWDSKYDEFKSFGIDFENSFEAGYEAFNGTKEYFISNYELGYAPLIALSVSCLNTLLSVFACIV